MPAKRILFTLLLIVFSYISVFGQENPETLSYNFSLSGFEDSGVFYLYKNEEPLGVMEFRWDKNGEFSSDFTLTYAGKTMKVHTDILPDPKGTWEKIDMQTQLGVVHLERKGRLIYKVFRGQQSTCRLEEENTALYEDSSPALLASLVRSYDMKIKGKQTFSIYVIPAIGLPATLEFRGEEERTVQGKELTFSKYIFELKGIEIILWIDKEGKVVLEDVPVQSAYVVRKGYEELAKKTVDDPLLSKPEFKFKVEKNVMIAMRDKVALATDIYLPETDKKVPLVFIRTPYGKDMQESEGKYWARRGYGVAVQDCRGRFKSEGKWVPFMNDAEDGYDSIEWLALTPWCNGRVGMIGGSYVGWVQWWAASQKPPHLVTMIPNVAPPDPHYNLPYEYGTFFLLASIWWAKILETEATADLSGSAMYEINSTDYTKILNTLPVIDIDKALLGKENPYWRSWIEHPDNGPFWEKANFLNKLSDLNIPVFHQSGWFDGDGIGSKLNYLKMSSFGHKWQKLILGPWGHTTQSYRMHGDKDFGKDAVIDLQREYLRWFDYWLKDIKNGVDAEPLVHLFVMGTNKWLTGNTYPLEKTTFKKLYLTSNGKANTSKGDGELSWDISTTKAESDAYTYDPADPTPDPDFYPTKSKEERKKTVISQEDEKKKENEYHATLTQERQDILIYVTEPLKEPLTICGPISAILYASSSGKDTDWYVSLYEQPKDGEIFYLNTRGKIRARYRDSLYKPELLEPGKVYEYKLDLWQVGITIPAGSRLRVEVASALFPMFSRNLNTGGHNETETQFVKADQKVYHSTTYPSHILLPVIPQEKEGGGK